MPTVSPNPCLPLSSRGVNPFCLTCFHVLVISDYSILLFIKHTPHSPTPSTPSFAVDSGRTPSGTRGSKVRRRGRNPSEVTCGGSSQERALEGRVQGPARSGRRGEVEPRLGSGSFLSGGCVGAHPSPVPNKISAAERRVPRRDFGRLGRPRRPGSSPPPPAVSIEPWWPRSFATSTPIVSAAAKEERRRKRG